MRFFTSILVMASCLLVVKAFAGRPGGSFLRRPTAAASLTTMSLGGKKGKLLVLGGTGFLGQTVCKRALLEGYEVTSLSRRGVPETGTDDDASLSAVGVDYRLGDARKKETVTNILGEGGYTGILHCIGLLFDDQSGLGQFNAFASGSGSLPDANSSYDTITRLTAFNAIEAVTEYAQGLDKPFPFGFTSAAEAGWPDMGGGAQVERFLAPKWLKRYLVAKRAVEAKLLETPSLIRPVMFRPSLIYSLDRPKSYVPVGAFFVGNAVGLPFVDRPVTVQALACAMVRAMDRDEVSGVQRYAEIDALSQ